MTAVAWPADLPVTESDASGTPCVDVPPDRWVDAALVARDAGFTYFDWLSAVDEPEAASHADPAATGPAPAVDVVLHVVALAPVRRLLLRTRLTDRHPSLPSLTAVFAGAAWHERETHEMFGIDFTGFDDGTDGGLRPLLLPDGFEGTPLRKSFVLASRAVKPWPGAKEPGESDSGGASPSRRKLLPPGVPDASWGPRRPAATADGADGADGAGGPARGQDVVRHDGDEGGAGA